MGTKYSGKEWKLLAVAVIMLLMVPLFGGVIPAHAGPGKGMDAAGNLGVVQTYYANSPSGLRTDPVTGAASAIDTGTALRKFVDGLPLLGTNGASSLGTTGLTAGLNSAYGGTKGVSIPVAVADRPLYDSHLRFRIAEFFKGVINALLDRGVCVDYRAVYVEDYQLKHLFRIFSVWMFGP